MGRPFADEIGELEESYRWARGADIESLSRGITRLSGQPLFAVGSGGSLTTATMAAGLFRDFGLNFSSPITPLELAARSATLRGASVFIATAGGSNPDVIGALRLAAKSEAAHVLALCASVGSRLASESSRFSNVSVEEFESPSGKDGFLATNSLLTSAVLLTRAFAAANNIALRLPKQLYSLVGARGWQAFVNSVAKRASELWHRDTLVVLYGPTAHPAAVDLESKLTEAALSNVWMADYRHFAHGRHHWLAKRGSDSSLVAFISSADRHIADKTLEQIPATIPRIIVELPDGPLAMVAALANVFPIVHSAGLACGIDPGKPGVPAFGRRIYRLNAFGRKADGVSSVSPRETAAIERKSQKSIARLSDAGELSFWRTAYADVLNRIGGGHYSGIVFDYDGTLCAPSGRVSTAVTEQLRRLVEAGCTFGVATGRGKSVREDMRKAIPREYWSQIVIGYYNGGQIGLLLEDECPDGTPTVPDDLVPVLSALQSNSRLTKMARIEGRLNQVTLTAKSPRFAEECWHLISHIVHLTPPSGIKLVRSSHSFDILSAEVSKLSVIGSMPINEREFDVLSIGDMGRWPGNDHELLSHPFSLSVDQVSPDRDTCWNLSAPGVHGVQATLDLLTRIRVNTKGIARLVLPQSSGKGRK